MIQKYIDKELELQTEFIADAQSKTDKELKEWMQNLSKRKAKAQQERAYKLVQQGYPTTDTMLEKMGYSEGDIAKNFEALPYKVTKIKPDGTIEVVEKFKYRLQDAVSYEERAAIGLSVFMNGHLEMSKTDTSAMKSLHKAITDKMDAIANLEQSEKSDKEKYGQLKEFVAELDDARNEYDVFIDKLASKYNIQKLFKEHQKEQKETTDAFLENYIRPELFTISLMNLKITYLQSVINDRIMQRSNKIVELAKREIGNTYTMPTPSGKRK